MNTNPEPIPKIKHDGQLTIATGRSRKETDWKNRQMLWSELTAKLGETTRTRETLAEYDAMTRDDQNEIKDVGGFVGGTLKGGRRLAQAVAWRQVVTLDADFATAALWDDFALFNDYAALVYSTHKHRPGKARLRLVIPLARPVNPDEYQAIARKIADGLGMDLWDDTTYQPHRLMYWPSTSADGEFFFRLQDAPWLNPDEILALYPDWTDQSYWPESSRTKNQRKKMADKQGDPLEKPGVVGAFCRTYTIDEAIGIFLSDVYEPCAMEGRYTYSAGSSAGGLVLYEDKFAYSHHGTDPISGKLVNVFDLVRLHKFGELDDDAAAGTPANRLPSYLAMQDLANEDDRVKETRGRENLEAAKEEFAGMIEEDPDAYLTVIRKLKSNRNGTEETINNFRIILEEDPNLAGRVAWNEFSHQPTIRGPLPWRRYEKDTPWQDSDDAALRHYVETNYKILSSGKVADALAVVLEKHKYHPVREYLDSLWWDGVPRIDTLFIDYLGAEDCLYTRKVTRKMLAAAVARVYDPGCKFDYMATMIGPQGLGKSALIKRLARSWHSDSFTTVQGKEAYEQLTGAWIIEVAELTATRKAEVEAVKHFISKQEDAYRVAYGKRISHFPRQCVFFGTTNDQECLRDKTGNRRFWPVDVGITKPARSIWTDLDDYEIGQLWAEAAETWRTGEPLYLEAALERDAQERQDRHTEDNPKAGMIAEYLDMLLPENWSELDIITRRNFIQGVGDFTDSLVGTEKRTRVCIMEIWSELFRDDPKKLTLLVSRELNDVMKKIPGWIPTKTKSRQLYFGKLYGYQRAYVRDS